MVHFLIQNLNTLTIFASDVLIGVSVSGVAKLWSLHDSNLKENGVNELFEDESKFISSRNVSTVAFSEKNVRMMLVICGNSWQV
jgi:hypothetical protein